LLVAAWSRRLGLPIVDRTRGAPEDRRYTTLRAGWGTGFERRMLWFLQIQPAAAALLTLAVLLAARNPRDGIGVAALPGIAGLVIAVLGEATADAARLVPLNRYSAAVLTAFLGWLFSRLA
jgi:steroid 5-alpha reductase family enzyme